MTKWRVALGLAAAAALLAGTGAYLLLRPHIHRTAIGGFLRVVLEDYTVMELNTDTEVRVVYGYGSSLRTVELDRGEATFRVARDAKRPFVVITGDTAVRALGTRFNVRRLPEVTELIVVDGSVAVGATTALARSGSSLAASISQVTAGQGASVGPKQQFRLETLSPSIIERRLAWRTGKIVFDSTPLEQVAAELNRYNRRRLMLEGTGLGALTLSGRFGVMNLEGVVEAVRQKFGVQVETNPEWIKLKAAPTGQP
jgi:transmembrane sensor